MSHKKRVLSKYESEEASNKAAQQHESDMSNSPVGKGIGKHRKKEERDDHNTLTKER